ncbi:proline-rich receptor-like protein kinase PERK12 [Iris pallida]|uniref:Proline-rich receptor-like protein kinase PERK12 n=1 Tax=Iris pallida TaxID=29817 RepID=A0AAX6F770_IRIPA|nr:proline-rich receptor-like protein kinase PERK12 [Iris pallida]
MGHRHRSPWLGRCPRAPHSARQCATAHSSSCVRTSARARGVVHRRRRHSRRGRVPLVWTPSDDPLRSVVSSSSATYRRFVHFARRPVVTRARLSPFWRSVAATSRTFFWRSDCWIDDFFALSQSRFAGPTSSACISSTAAPFGVLLVLVRSWTLWLQ